MQQRLQALALPLVMRMREAAGGVPQPGRDSSRYGPRSLGNGHFCIISIYPASFRRVRSYIPEMKFDMADNVVRLVK